MVPKPIENLDDTTIDNIIAGVAMSVFIDRQGCAYWCGQGVGGLEKVKLSANVKLAHSLTLQQVAMVPTKLSFAERLKTASIGDDHMIIQTRLFTTHCFHALKLVPL